MDAEWWMDKLPPGTYTACGGKLNDPDRYPSAIYKGRLVYFCNDACLEAFEADPDGFMSGKIKHPLGQE